MSLWYLIVRKFEVKVQPYMDQSLDKCPVKLCRMVIFGH